MFDDVFSSTDLSGTPRLKAAEVLGRDLLPLSVWHIWILQGIRSPFAIGGRIEDKDVGMAVAVCSKNRAECVAFLSDEVAVAKEMLQLAELWHSEEDMTPHIAALNSYMEDGMTAPEFWENPGQNPVKDRQRCPSEWHLVSLLLKNNICRTERQAWDYPYARAVCWAAVSAEQQGSRNYIDPIDRKQIDELNHANDPQ